MLSIRRKYPVLADRNNMLMPDTVNQHLFVYARTGTEPVLVAANLTDSEQHLEAAALFQVGMDSHRTFNLLNGEKLKLEPRGIVLGPYDILWLTDKIK